VCFSASFEEKGIRGAPRQSLPLVQRTLSPEEQNRKGFHSESNY
jgi:hypothetical protein